MQALHQIMRSNVDKVFPYLFGFIFFASGFYTLQFLGLSVQQVVLIKRGLFGGFMCIMALSINWERIKPDAFFLCCFLWVGLNLIIYLIHGGDVYVYLLRVAQTTFLWVFVSYLRQQNNPFGFIGVGKWFLPRLVSIIACGLLWLSFSPVGAEILAGGFGNNRVNFSIWLSQLVFLNFLLFLLEGKRVTVQMFIKVILTVTPILLLQVFSGARTGILVSMALCIYFAYRFLSVKVAFLTAVWLFLCISLGGAWSPLQYAHPGTALARATEIGTFTSTHDPYWQALFHWLDMFSSYRLGISVDAMTRLDGLSLLIGKGIGNFQGYAIGRMWEVHNIYLRGLGELGFLGALVLVAIVVMPLRSAPDHKQDRFARFFCLCALFVGFIHPEFINTAVSTCLLYWVAFAQLAGRYTREEVTSAAHAVNSSNP